MNNLFLTAGKSRFWRESKGFCRESQGFAGSLQTLTFPMLKKNVARNMTGKGSRAKILQCCWWSGRSIIEQKKRKK